jgi:hypothetical protein
MWKNRCLLILLFFLFLPFAYGQDEKVVLPLREVLEQISVQHNIRFNYIEDEIIVFRIDPPPKAWELDAKIDYIKSQTKLKITVTDGKYYTISNDHKVDKPLCGYLIDSETKYPIENASIQIEGAMVKTSTNEHGYFELPIVSPNAIQFRHQSYIPKNINVKDLYVGN